MTATLLPKIAHLLDEHAALLVAAARASAARDLLRAALFTLPLADQSKVAADLRTAAHMAEAACVGLTDRSRRAAGRIRDAIETAGTVAGVDCGEKER